MTAEMISLDIDLRVPAYETYRANRVKSLFNATDEQATSFRLRDTLELPEGWSIGVVVGPSGSGKSSIGRAFWGPEFFYEADGWEPGVPIIDGIAPGGSFDDVTAALSSAGLGDVPAWLRPYEVLSTGQKFRADLARVLAQKPGRVVFDEFTSVVDRQIAQVGSGAFAKAWRRTGGQAVLLSCHYDILDWVEPDWVYDTATRKLTRRGDRDDDSEGIHRWKRPRIDVEIRLGGWELWPLFKPHHYLDAGPMIGAKCYVGFVDGEPVAHVGVGTKNVLAGGVQAVEARACRMVVMPEWQGAGVGMRVLNEVCRLQLEGEGVLPGRRMTTVFHTSHPGLAAALRRDRRWRQVSGVLHGTHKGKSAASIRKTSRARMGCGYGGHLRAVQGFRYYGEEAR